MTVRSMTIRNAVLSAGDLFLEASDPGMGVSECEVAGFHEEPDAAQEVFLNNSLIPPTEQCSPEAAGHQNDPLAGSQAQATQ